jgi:protein-tyrosine phosphatase
MMTMAERVVALAGACNLRDLGGYRTRDGRQIRKGVVFRSGVLSYFAPDDHAALLRLGVKTICDLRNGDERTKEPTNWPGDAQIMCWDLDSSVADAIRKSGWERPESAQQAREILIDSYQSIPYWLAPHLRGLFQSLARHEIPLLFHCAAGKDRTGISAAILLHTLGVPRETIIEDYELTNHAVDLDAFMARNQHARLGLSDEKKSLTTLGDDIKKVMFSADPDYLMAALEKIEREQGSIDNFVRDILNIGVSDQNRIRELLLTD